MSPKRGHPYFADSFPYFADDKPYFADDKPYLTDDNPYIADIACSQGFESFNEIEAFSL